MNFTTNFTSACLGIFLLAAFGCLAGDQAANQPSGELGFTSLFPLKTNP